jgi:hypothetical protein
VPFDRSLLTRQGLTAAELQKGGVHAARWPEVERALLERIQSTLQVLSRRIGSSG